MTKDTPPIQEVLLPVKGKDPETGQFVKGYKGGGRPKGSRNKLGEAFLADLQKDWSEHGARALEKCRKRKPDVYVKVVASLLPKDLMVNVSIQDTMTDGELQDTLDNLKELRARLEEHMTPELKAELLAPAEVHVFPSNNGDET